MDVNDVFSFNLLRPVNCRSYLLLLSLLFYASFVAVYVLYRAAVGRGEPQQAASIVKDHRTDWTFLLLIQQSVLIACQISVKYLTVSPSREASLKVIVRTDLPNGIFVEFLKVNVSVVEHVVSAIIPNASSLSEVPKFESAVTAAGQAQEVSVLLTEHYRFHGSLVATHFQPYLFLVVGSDIMQYQAVVRISNYNSIS